MYDSLIECTTSSRMHVWTIGHSVHAAPDFIHLLRVHSIEHLVDIRRFPGSNRHPQFSQPALRAVLQAAGIAYTWMEGLGGYRGGEGEGARAHSQLKNKAFRSYAAYMGTATFLDSLNTLTELMGQNRTVLMCAEALFWNCHRSILSDKLVADGVIVHHIMDAKNTKLHTLTPSARVDGAGSVWYDQKPVGSQLELLSIDRGAGPS